MANTFTPSYSIPQTTYKMTYIANPTQEYFFYQKSSCISIGKQVIVDSVDTHSVTVTTADGREWTNTFANNVLADAFITLIKSYV